MGLFSHIVSKETFHLENERIWKSQKIKCWKSGKQFFRVQRQQDLFLQRDRREKF